VRFRCRGLLGWALEQKANVRASYRPSIDATAAASYGLPVEAT
jgi:hypothetical protein